jgi:hypothetical protein
MAQQIGENHVEENDMWLLCGNPAAFHLGIL